MANNQINPNQESNQLSDEELEAVAGGTIGEKVDNIVDAGKNLVGDVVDAGKDFIKNITTH